MKENIIRIGSRREFFWDDYLIDIEQTSVTAVIHQAVRKEPVVEHNAPWEGDGCDYNNIVAEDGYFRMYYLGWQMLNDDSTEHTLNQIRVCYMESINGINWVKPNLGLCDYNGSKDNNILLDEHSFPHVKRFGNFCVMKDPNPDCLPEQKYKALYACDYEGHRGLSCAFSSDGIHWEPGIHLQLEGAFDSTNLLWFDEIEKKYVCFLRDFHGEGTSVCIGGDIRDIRRAESIDLIHWTKPEMVDFGGGDDYALYTSLAMPYYRGNHIYVAFPTRYVERVNWTSNFDHLPSPEQRKKRSSICIRYGTSITDCVFACSRDGGKSWKRFDEAFIRPGKENKRTWVYGDAYPAINIIETPSELPEEDNDVSLFCEIGGWLEDPATMWRYTSRIDGFASRHATYKPQMLVTKPFIFIGDSLSINFETSAIGYIRLEITDKNGRPIDGFCSGELFGDSVNRTVDFQRNISDLSGKAIRMKLEMSDADIYSFRFC